MGNPATRCALVVQSQQQFNRRIDRLELGLRGPLAGRLLLATIARLEASRTMGNAQFGVALRSCAGA